MGIKIPVRMLDGHQSIFYLCKFGNKHGVFVESLKCYENIFYFRKLQNGKDGVNESVFYDSVRMPSELGDKGCLLTNTYNEFADTEDQIITVQMNEFMNNKAIFITKLRADNSKDEAKH
jgi:hypothetical protein